MGIYFEENDPEAPWCACGTLCDGAADPLGRVGWCFACEDWATRFARNLECGDDKIPVSDPPIEVFDPGRKVFRPYDPVEMEWLDS